MHTYTKACCAAALALTLQAGTASITSAAPASVSVQLNGKALTFDQAPVLKNNRTLVPMRTIFEALGADIQWDAKTRVVTAKNKQSSISLQIGSKKAIVNEKTLTLDTEAQLIKGRTMIPVRFISESLGATVQWNGKTNTVVITTPSVDEQTPPPVVVPTTPTKPVEQEKTPVQSTPTSSGGGGGGSSSSSTTTPSKDPAAPTLQDKLLGSWKTNYSGFDIDVIFAKDGSANLLGGMYQGSYNTDGDKMTLSVPSMNRTTSGTVKFVSEKEFTVTSPGGSVATFSKN